MGEVYNLNDTSEGKALKAPSVPIFTHDLVNFEVSAQERIRLATDGARYKGLLPADFQIAGLADSKPQSKKHSGYKQQRVPKGTIEIIRKSKKNSGMFKTRSNPSTDAIQLSDVQ